MILNKFLALVKVKIGDSYDGGWSVLDAFNSSDDIFQAFDYTKLTKENRKQNYELAFQTGE